MKRHYTVAVTFYRVQGTRLTVALLSLFIMHGCAFKFDNIYPEEWPPPLPVEPEICPDISGTYYNQDFEAITRQEFYLYASITGKVWETYTCDRCPVELAWQDSKRSILRVTLFDESLLSPQTATLESSKGQFYCPDGSLHVPFREGRWRVIAGAFLEGEMRFFPADDGSLIAEYLGSGVGHVYIIPVATEGNRYLRWLQVGP